MGELPQGPQWVGWEGTALGVPVCCVVVAVSPYPLVPPCTPMSHIPVSPGPHIPRTWSDSRGGGAGGGRGDPTYPMAPPIPWPHPLVTPPPPIQPQPFPQLRPVPFAPPTHSDLPLTASLPAARGDGAGAGDRDGTKAERVVGMGTGMGTGD